MDVSCPAQFTVFTVVTVLLGISLPHYGQGRGKEKKYRKMLNKSTIVCTFFWKSTGNCSQNIAINYTILGAIEVTEAHSMC